MDDAARERERGRAQPRADGYVGLLVVLIGVLVVGGLAAYVVTHVTFAGTTNLSLPTRTSSSPGLAPTHAAAIEACKSTARSVQSAVEAFQAQTGTYPNAIATLVGTKTVAGVAEGPWLRQAPLSSAFAISVGPTGAVVVRAPPSAEGVTFADQPTAACDHAR